MFLYIIMPIYNAEKYVEDAINSVVEGNGNIPYRLLLIDDGSTDSSSEICKGFAEKNSSVLYFRQENQGVSVARNRGLSYVYGKAAEDTWIGFLDADDVWHKNWGGIIYSACNKDADIIGFGMDITDENLKSESSIIPEIKRVSGGYDTAIGENRKLHFGS